MGAKPPLMAKGSHASFGPYPRSCAGCGQPIRIGGERPLWFETQAPGWQPTSWHADCHPQTHRKPKPR